ncbi:hypothetical protein ACFLUR_01415 [Chloroflexota bacterium]
MHKSRRGSLKWLAVIGVLVALVVVAVGCASTPAEVTEEIEEDCTTCHDGTSTLKAVQVQWENSLHGGGLTFERNTGSCAACHTAQGFVTYSEDGAQTLEALVDNPAPINCRTCHTIHSTYTDSDWALRVTDPVTIALTGDTIDMGAANLCTTCHQPREATGLPVVGGGDAEIASTRFGPHHGPQSTMLAGLAGYGDYSGSNVHMMVEDTCLGCHMADAFGKQAGGHTMSMSYEYHGADVQNTAGCESCHGEVEDFNIGGAQTEVEELGDELRVLLEDAGLLKSDGYAIPGTYSSAEAGALWNYRMVILEDRSSGVHNPAFAKFLLQTGIDAMK